MESGTGLDGVTWFPWLEMENPSIYRSIFDVFIKVG